LKNAKKSYTRRQVEAILKECKLNVHVLRAVPELVPLMTCSQPPEHHSEGNAFFHTWLVLKYTVTHKEGVKDPDLLWAAVLHDIGKPAAFAANDGITMKGHHKHSAAIAEKVLKRLNFARNNMEKVLWLVHNHMRVFEGHNMSDKTFWGDGFAGSKLFPLLLRLNLADCLASKNPEGRYDITIYNKVRARYMAGDPRRKNVRKDVLPEKRQEEVVVGSDN
jgi:poly(A) polymerase